MHFIDFNACVTILASKISTLHESTCGISLDRSFSEMHESAHESMVAVLIIQDVLPKKPNDRIKVELEILRL